MPGLGRTRHGMRVRVSLSSSRAVQVEKLIREKNK